MSIVTFHKNHTVPVAFSIPAHNTPPQGDIAKCDENFSLLTVKV